MIINLPKLGPVKFRDDLSADEVKARVLELSQKYGFELPRPEYGVFESGIRGLQRGLTRAGSLVGDVIPALGASALGFDDYARQQLEEAAETERQIQRENEPGFTSFKQIQGPVDFLKYGAETLGETLPDIAGIVGSGGIGGLLGRRAVTTGAKELAERIGEREALRDVLPGGVAAERAAELEATALRRMAPAIKESEAFGQAAGVYLGSYAINTPDVFQSIYENTGELAPGASILFGGAVAALDAVLPKQLLNTFTQTEKLSVAEQILKRSGMDEGFLRKAAAIIPVTAAKEGLTEGTQEFITAAAEKFVDNTQDLWSSENFNRYLESAVRGAVAGGGFGTVQAAGERIGERSRERKKEYEEYQRQMQEAQPREPQQLSLFQPGEITPPSPGLTFPSPKVEEKEPVTARTEYKDSKEMRKSMLGLRPEPYEVVPSAVEGQMELFEPEAKGKKRLQPTPEADVQALEKKLKEEQKKKIAEGKAEEQALKEAIAELAPKDIDLLNYAQRTGITSTPLFQLVQQATEIPGPKGKQAKPAEVPAPAPAPAPAITVPATVLTAEKLKGTGLSPQSGFYRRLVGKDLVADEALIRSEIEKAQANPKLSPSTIAALEGLEGEIPLALTQPTPETLAQRTAPTAPELQTQEPPAQVVPEVPEEQMGFDFTEPTTPEYVDFPIANLRRPNGAIGTQGVTEEQIRDLLVNVTGLEIPESASMREMVDLFKSDVEAQNRLRGFTESNPIQITPLPDGTYHLRDGHHRAFLLNQLGDETIPAQLNEQKQTTTTTKAPAAPLDLGTPDEVWDAMDTGVQYKDLSKAKQEEWEQAVSARVATPERADALADSHRRDLKETKRKKPVAEEELEEPTDIGEQEAATVDSNVEINNYIEENTTEEDRKLITEDKQLGNGNYEAGVEKLKKYVAQSIAGKLQAGIKKAVRDLVEKIKQGMMSFIIAVNFAPQIPVDLVTMPEVRTERYAYQKQVDNQSQTVGKMAERVANYALNEGNGAPFMVIDKENATLYAYNAQGKLLDKTAILLGKTIGDVRPTIGKPLGQIKDEERITPAGKFTGKFVANQMYGSVVTLAETLEPGVGVVAVHRMYLGNPAERRMERFKTPDAKDNRIGMGCLNVPDSFYDNVVAPNYKVNSQIFVMPDLEDAVDYFGIKDKDIKISGGRGVKEKERKVEVVGREEKLPPKEDRTEKKVEPTKELDIAEKAEVSGLEKAKALVGEELRKLVSSIGGVNNLTPEEQGSLGDFMSALGNLMYELIKSGAKTFAMALPIAKRRARKELGDLAAYVPDSAYKQAYEEVKSGKVNPTQQSSKFVKQLDKVINAPYKDLPPASKEIVEGALNALSNMPSSLRSVALAFMTMDQIFEVYGKIMPSIKKLIKALEVRASDVAQRREFLEKNIKKYHEVFKKYTPAQKQKFFQTFFDTTVEQIEPLVVTVKETIDSNGQVRRVRTYSLTKNPETANNPITQAFYAMPKEVQEVYVDMRREYDNYADELENLITKDVSPGTAKKLRTQFELRRLKVYLPLYRQGNYWLSYTDSAGENVVMAFSSERERQLEKQRAIGQKAKEIKEFARFEDIVSRTGAPPVGFVGKILKTLKDEKVPKAVMDQVYSSYLSLFPAESVRQMYRKRKGIEGYEKDAVEVFANVGSRMVNQIGNLKHAEAIDTAMSEIISQGEVDGSMAAREVAANIAAQTDYIMNPVPNKISAGLSTFSYYSYIAGNVSSALINLTQLPIVVYSLLGGEYGFNDAYEAMKKATSMYLNGGKDDNSAFLPDWTFGNGKNVRSDLKRLYDEAVKQSVIRRSTSHEIVDMRKHKAGDYVGMRAKVETGLAWMFQNSERANREITLIAAYELARKKGLSEQAAIEKAMNTVKAAHGSSLSETGPRMFQGNIGRVIFTFKRFAQSQIYLLQKLFRQAFGDADPEVRAVARKQLLGIYGMAFMFAGAQGVPLYGAASMLAGFLMGDDDEPVDVDEYVRSAVGDMVYKGPINQLLNIDIASRTGFNNMVWRDNPKRLAEVGPVTYMFEQLAGPSYSAAMSVQKGFKDISEGNGYRGLEAIMPGFIRNGMKGLRFAVEGATNRDGVPIIEDVNAYNVVMQITGFTPADLSEAYARAGAKKEVEKKILERRTSLLDKLYTAKREGDVDGAQEIREAIREFNRKNPERNVRITQDTIQRSYRGHQQREREMVDGVRINPALKRRLESEYGPN